MPYTRLSLDGYGARRAGSFAGKEAYVVTGQVVTFFNGVSRAPGGHQGVTRPIVHLTDSGGGFYSVTIVSGAANTKDDSVMDETYLIDGEPV